MGYFHCKIHRKWHKCDNYCIQTLYTHNVHKNKNYVVTMCGTFLLTHTIIYYALTVIIINTGLGILLAYNLKSSAQEVLHHVYLLECSLK